VRQFVRQQVVARARAGTIRALTKEDIAACGKGRRADAAIEVVGVGVRMHAHAGEVRVKGRFHAPARVLRQRGAAAAFGLDARGHAWADRTALQPDLGLRLRYAAVPVLLLILRGRPLRGEPA